MYNIVFRGEIIDTAHSREEAEGLADIYKGDYGPELKIVKDSDYVSYDDDATESYDEDYDPEYGELDDDLLY
jgi:hypothetical protein